MMPHVVKGVTDRETVQITSVMLSTSKNFPFYEKLAESNLIALFHTGYDPGPFSSDHATPKRLSVVRVKSIFPSAKDVRPLSLAVILCKFGMP